LSALLWFVYDRGIRRNGGFSRFGEIRLGDENQMIENNETDRMVNATVKFGLIIFSGIHAGFEMFKRSVRGLSDRFTGRMRSRRGPTYSSLMNDQFLDEADDLLAGHDEDANDLSSFIGNDTNFDIDDESNAASDVTSNGDVHVQPYNDNIETENTTQQPYTDDTISDEVPAPLTDSTTKVTDTTTDSMHNDEE